jgi:hypothetical protein
MICTPYLVYNQISLNLPRDDHNFSFSYGWSPFRLHKEIPKKNHWDSVIISVFFFFLW